MEETANIKQLNAEIEKNYAAMAELRQKMWSDYKKEIEAGKGHNVYG
ncbi:MAG: hypothetical protein LLF78_06520 [Synergistaceae bacterium]|nr:hypothetical protein [Synergistaceae bacterium]